MSYANQLPYPGFIGRFGDYVAYMLKNKYVCRRIGKSTKPATLKQLQYRTHFTLSSQLMTPAEEYIKIGFNAEGLAAGETPRNMMSSYTLKNAMKGDLKHQEVDFTKVLFSKGDMPPAPGVQAVLNDDVLEFSWDPAITSDQFRTNDQVMILAYFPELREAEYALYAGNRTKGSAKFSLIKQEKEVVAETYITFVSPDRKRVCNSIYGGRFILPASKTINTHRIK